MPFEEEIVATFCPSVAANRIERIILTRLQTLFSRGQKPPDLFVQELFVGGTSARAGGVSPQ
jgi:hypothetical protein